jgi:hypothetical protein
MHRFLVSAAGLLAAITSMSACGSDDDDPDDGSGGTGGTGGGANVTCTPGGGGACQNDTDCPKVESGEARSTAQTCGLGCQQDDDPATCSVGCIVRDAQISAGCAACYAALVGCASQNCLAPCAADPRSAACNQCQIDSGCRDNFDSCSGLDSSP